jgi:hypothetical protein
LSWSSIPKYCHYASQAVEYVKSFSIIIDIQSHPSL